MADLFLHLPFARRLRLAEGLHPLIGEALARRPSLVALGATLPLLPGVERKGMSFFRRLFSGGSEAARWQKQLAPAGTPRAAIVKAFVDGGHDFGPMARIALGLGFLSHELVEAKLAAVGGGAGGDKAAIERAQARLWLQAAVPTSLEAEWKSLNDLGDPELHKRTFDHIDQALRGVMQKGPGRDVLLRWAKGLLAELAPAQSQGLPPSLSVADHAARGPHFEQANFIALVQEATSWFVVLANRLGEAASRDEGLTTSSIHDALCGSGGDLLGADATGPTTESWTTWYNGTRQRMLERGRNEKPAFIEGVGEVKPIQRSSAFTGVMRLSDLPPEDVPPALQQASLPPEAAATAAPPVPAMTQEVSLAQIEGALPPLPLDASGPLPVAPPSAPPVLTQDFRPPAHTQEISVAQIEAEAAEGFQAPAHTQEVSAVQIEGQSNPGDDPPRE